MQEIQMPPEKPFGPASSHSYCGFLRASVSPVVDFLPAAD
jgi:hypothetical protein